MACCTRTTSSNWRAIFPWKSGSRSRTKRPKRCCSRSATRRFRYSTCGCRSSLACSIPTCPMYPIPEPKSAAGRPGMANDAPALEQALDAGPALLQVEDLRTWIDHGGGTVRAVDGVSLRIARGETFALLGESGCGKSMLALSILRLLPEGGRIVGGRVQLGDIDLLALTERGMRDIRGGRIAMIFQEPALSLNPVLSVGDQVAEAVRRHTSLRQAEVSQRVIDLLQQAGVPDPAARRNEYPFQLSGGLIQRVMIAMALAGEPELLIADEPTTALDVTIQAQVLEVLRRLRAERRMGMLLITHDLGVVAENADRVG